MVARTPALLDDDDGPAVTAPFTWPLLERLPIVLAQESYAPETYRRLVREAQDELNARFSAEEPVEALVRARAQFIDTLLDIAWRQHLDEQLRERLALIAVGGYGRGELHPYSDVDLLMLVPAGRCHAGRRGPGHRKAHRIPVGHRSRGRPQRCALPSSARRKPSPTWA